MITLAGCGAPESDDAPAREIAAGEAVYLAHCASCHGTQLEGQPNWQEPLADGGYPAPPHDGTGHTWRHSDTELFQATKLGGGFSAAPGSVSHMPAFGQVLSDDQIRSALAFVKSRWPVELQGRQRLLTRLRSQRKLQSRHEGNGQPRHDGHAGPRLDGHEGPRLDGHEGPRLDGHEGPRLDGHEGHRSGNAP